MSLHLLNQELHESGPDHSDVRANPATQTFHAMAVARALAVAARVGVFADLADGPSGVFELASRRGLRPDPLRMMLDVLVGQGLLEYRDAHYALSERGRRWLDPDSPTSITTFLSSTLDYWRDWADLDRIVAGGLVRPATPPPDDEQAWLRRIRADFEIARLIASEVAVAINLPTSARSVLDLGGGHGWFAAALCKRNSLLRATVVDTAGAVQIGREIMWETGMDRAVSHQVGDPFTADLGDGYDAALCLPMRVDLSPQKSSTLLSRIHRALQPGGIVAIVKIVQAEQPMAAPQPGCAAALDLFCYLQVRGECPPPGQLPEQLVSAGFEPLRVHRLSATPALCVHIARAI